MAKKDDQEAPETGIFSKDGIPFISSVGWTAVDWSSVVEERLWLHWGLPAVNILLSLLGIATSGYQSLFLLLLALNGIYLAHSVGTRWATIETYLSD